MRKALTIGGIAAGGLVALLLLAVLIIPNLIPQEVYRAEIEKVASQTLGRKVTVTGNISVAVFPRIEARAGASSIANPDGFGDAPFADMKELRAAVALWPLLFGSVEIEEFVLVEPAIALVNLEDGRNNWTFDLGGGDATEAEPAPGGTMKAALRDVRIEKGRVTWDDRQAKTLQTLSDLDLSADMQAIDRPLSLKAKGLANELAFDVEARLENPQALIDGRAAPMSVKLKTDMLNTDVDGVFTLAADPKFDFKVTGDIPSITRLADAFKVTDLPARDVLGALSLEGQAFGSASDITIKIANAEHKGPLLNAKLTGETRIAGGIALQLDASAEAPRLADLARAMQIAAPAEQALGKATAAAKVSGRLDDLQFTGVRFRHDSGLLNLAFDGVARLRDQLTYDGQVSIAAPDLRRLAAAAGATLPEGPVYKAFSLTGRTSGNATDVMLKDAVMTFDGIAGKGEAALAFGGARPRLTGALTTGPIDVTPYARASGAPTDAAPTQGWPATPIDLAPLRLVDAALNLRTGPLKFDAFDFGPSNVAVTLIGGRLVADLTQTTLFGGKGAARVALDGAGAKPAMELKANIDGLQMKNLLQAAANFGMVEGVGDLEVELAGSGADLRTLMTSLAGKGGFAFDKGALTGVNLQVLADAAKAALTKQQIPPGALSANARTPFDTLKTGFAMTEGVAVLTGLSLESGSFLVSGGGALDIGRQQVSLKLVPQYKSKDQGLNGYGLPLELSGSWGGIRLALDWDWLKDKAVASATGQAKAKIDEEIRDFGDDLLKKLGLGGKAPAAPAQPPPAQPTPAQPAPAPAQPPPPPAPEGAQAPAAPAQPAPAAPPPQSAEDRLKAEAQKQLDRLLGRGD